MNRRQVIVATVAGAVTPAIATSAPDPLVSALDEYKAGLARFNAELPDDYTDEEANAFAEVTYARVYEMDPLPAATTLGGVVAALRTVLSEAESASLDGFCERNIRAALAYFEREGL